MPPRGDVEIRDLRPADQGAAVELLSDAFLEFPGMQVIVGTGAGARDRLRRIYEMEFEPAAGIRAIAAVVDGRLVGALTYADAPTCSANDAGRTFLEWDITGAPPPPGLSTRCLRVANLLTRLLGSWVSTPLPVGPAHQYY